MAKTDNSSNIPGQTVSAAMLAIGDELLTGKTQDKNIAFLARFLAIKGIDLKEVRIVSDELDAIIHAVNELRGNYTYLFTSGGIGPTHDDITAEAIAKAFAVDLPFDERALKLLGDHYFDRGLEFTEARKRMARIPTGAKLIDNPVSIAPGFNIDNVYVMAGVPAIFQAMLDTIAPGLTGGKVIEQIVIDCHLGEGEIGSALAKIQDRYQQTAIGSYPKFDGNRYSTQVVIRSRNINQLEAAQKDVHSMLKEKS